MRLIAQVLLALVLAAVIGLGLTALAVRSPPGFGEVRSGPWTSHPLGEAGRVNPYVLAHLATSGELPLARGDGLAFTATTDDDGQPLRGRCFYRVTGAIPSARTWTLTVTTATGGVIANPSSRAGFAASAVLRDADGHIDIAVGPEARPGDWLPTGRENFALMLRLYETTVGDNTIELDGALPAIRRVSCP